MTRLPTIEQPRGLAAPLTADERAFLQAARLGLMTEGEWDREWAEHVARRQGAKS